jgi:hypothetical protein
MYDGNETLFNGCGTNASSSCEHRIYNSGHDVSSGTPTLITIEKCHQETHLVLTLVSNYNQGGGDESRNEAMRESATPYYDVWGSSVCQ